MWYQNYYHLHSATLEEKPLPPEKTKEIEGLGSKVAEIIAGAYVVVLLL